MKKIIMILVCGAFCNAFNTGLVAAQNATDITYSGAAPKTVKKTAVSNEEDPAAGTIADPGGKTSLKEMRANIKAAKTNLRITNHLNKCFKNISDLTWGNEEKAIVATFKMNAKSARVVYDKRGIWLYTIISYSEDQMPRDIRSKILANFSGFTISLVQEVSQHDTILYKVHLEDCNRIKQVLVCNDEITTYADFRKS